MEFHEKVQELRRKKGLTQEELANALYVSRTAVSKWESGRGYPGIDSLKALAGFFSVTVDELLCGDQVLSIAEEERKQRRAYLRNLVFGLLDCSVTALLFFPFFGQKVDGIIQAVPLLALNGISSWLKTVYIAAVIGIVLSGALSVVTRKHPWIFWTRNGNRISLALNGAAALLFIVSPQPYVAAFLFVYLIVKALMLLKRQ